MSSTNGLHGTVGQFDQSVWLSCVGDSLHSSLTSIQPYIPTTCSKRTPAHWVGLTHTCTRTTAIPSCTLLTSAVCFASCSASRRKVKKEEINDDGTTPSHDTKQSAALLRIQKDFGDLEVPDNVELVKHDELQYNFISSSNTGYWKGL